MHLARLSHRTPVAVVALLLLALAASMTGGPPTAARATSSEEDRGGGAASHAALGGPTPAPAGPGTTPGSGPSCAATAAGAADQPSRSAVARAPVQRGVTLVAWGAGQYRQPHALIALGELAATGADWVSLIVTGYQRTHTSTTISRAGRATPTDADLSAAIARARELGLKVMLKPHVDLTDDLNPALWRGSIGTGFTSEEQWAAWFASYRDFIGHYATLARAQGVDQLVVGTELDGTIRRAADWRRVVDAVRARYAGPLTYAASAGSEGDVAWWDQLDYIGVDAYYPLTDYPSTDRLADRSTDRANRALPDLLAAWTPHLGRLAALACAWGRPVLVTEIGYLSRAGTTRHPWDYLSPGAVDLREQADAYEAALQRLSSQSWLAGVFWWAWETDPAQGGPCDDGYSPHDKDAEDVLRRWSGAPRRPTPTPAPRADYGRTLDIYADGLRPGWQDWSWDATRDLAATDQVARGSRAISVLLGRRGALSLWHPALRLDGYTWLEFDVRGSSARQPVLEVFAWDAEGSILPARPVNDCRYLEGGTVEPGRWKRVRIPLVDLNPAGRPLVRLAIQDRSGQGTGRFWLDDVRLVGAGPATPTPRPTPSPTPGPGPAATPTAGRAP